MATIKMPHKNVQVINIQTTISKAMLNLSESGLKFLVNLAANFEGENKQNQLT